MILSRQSVKPVGVVQKSSRIVVVDLQKAWDKDAQRR